MNRAKKKFLAFGALTVLLATMSWACEPYYDHDHRYRRYGGYDRYDRYDRDWRRGRYADRYYDRDDWRYERYRDWRRERDRDNDDWRYGRHYDRD